MLASSLTGREALSRELDDLAQAIAKNPVPVNACLPICRSIEEKSATRASSHSSCPYLLRFGMPARVPQRKALPTTSAPMLDILEAAAKVRNTGEDDCGEEQASCPGTSGVVSIVHCVVLEVITGCCCRLSILAWSCLLRPSRGI